MCVTCCGKLKTTIFLPTIEKHTEIHRHQETNPFNLRDSISMSGDSRLP